jgi:hypothetical protein
MTIMHFGNGTALANLVKALKCLPRLVNNRHEKQYSYTTPNDLAIELQRFSKLAISLVLSSVYEPSDIELIIRGAYPTWIVR